MAGKGPSPSGFQRNPCSCRPPPGKTTSSGLDWAMRMHLTNMTSSNPHRNLFILRSHPLLLFFRHFLPSGFLPWIFIDTATCFAAQASGLHVLHHQGRWTKFLAQRFVEVFEDVQARIES